MRNPVKSSLPGNRNARDQDEAYKNEMDKHDDDHHVPTGALVVALADLSLKEWRKKEAKYQAGEDETDVSEEGGHEDIDFVSFIMANITEIGLVVIFQGVDTIYAKRLFLLKNKRLA